MSGPLLPARLQQPELILPFELGRVWSYTSGPHKAWDTEGALAALDFAPSSQMPGCVDSDAMVVAMGDGPIVRVGPGIIVQDLDTRTADGSLIKSDWIEWTGWSILYMHIQSPAPVPLGAYLHTGDVIGHPSCEGGPATGTHTHVARKYNGEWIPAGQPTLPFVLSGWTAHAGTKPFEGTLTLGDQLVVAHPYGSSDTRISRVEP
jgi:hypothetical protein